ncbi:MAG: helix-turn-helix transcriptional regulator [Clostridia bacterium]|nr:helix-turn-helix transcriptional regulator [Clostridia bacterium]MBN2884288.1 helix-turn-helix transcriptional regulator [Clostridia bacterium]
MDIYKKLGIRIREQRKKRGLSQETLAEMCNLGTSYIGIIERAEKRASIITLVKIANALQISTDYLLGDSINYTNDSMLESTMSSLKDMDEEDFEYVGNLIKTTKEFIRKRLTEK